MSTRNRIQQAVDALLREIAEAIDDEDLTSAARDEMIRLHGGIYRKLQAFNKPTGHDPMSDGGPTQADVKGEVQHDIG